MKKTLLLGGMLSMFFYADAQQRLVMYEEFSGENCAPCAQLNPLFWDFLNTAPNANRVVLLKYQTNIPPNAIRPLYDQNATEADARLNYYAVNSAPNGRVNGRKNHPGPNAGWPGGYLQAGGQDSMNNEINTPSPFNIIVAQPTVSGSTLNASITVNAVAGYSGTNVKLRVALVESLHYTTAPGNNGEVDFHNVMRKMYPNTDGQTIPNTWTSGQNATYTISGAIPQYVDKAAETLFLLVWIQDDGNKSIAQAAKSAHLPVPALDVKATISTPVNGTLFCGTANTAQHKVTLKNTGTTTVTSADIYYKVGNGAYTAFNWTGSLAANASTDVTIGTVTVAGNTVITDSVGKLNGVAEVNPANSVAKTTVTGVASGSALPLETGFENGMAAGYTVFNGSNQVVTATKGAGGDDWFAGQGEDPMGPDNTTWAAAAPNFNSDPGYTTVLSFPYATMPAGDKSLDFYYAHALRGSTGDRLDIVYSTDCGANWTSVWNKSGTDLATAPATGEQNLFIPTPSQWRFGSVSLSAVTGDALIGFKSSSNGGNYLFIDKVKLRSGTPTGIEELVSGGSVTLYPNPVTNQVNIDLNMVKPAQVTFSIVNVVGQVIGTPVVKTLSAGNSVTNIATDDLAPGIYFMNIVTEKGSIQQKFVKQ